jgi:hypothetical protein
MTMVQERSPTTITRKARPVVKPLNAQQVTLIATNFLKSLKYKRGVEPKRVFIEEGRYVVEAEIGRKMLAKVQIDINTSEIKEYGIEKINEETHIGLPIEPKAMLIVFGISAAVSLIFALLNLNSLLASIF